MISFDLKSVQLNTAYKSNPPMVITNITMTTSQSLNTNNHGTNFIQSKNRVITFLQENRTIFSEI